MEKIKAITLENAENKMSYVIDQLLSIEDVIIENELGLSQMLSETISTVRKMKRVIAQSQEA